MSNLATQAVRQPAKIIRLPEFYQDREEYRSARKDAKKELKNMIHSLFNQSVEVLRQGKWKELAEEQQDESPQTVNEKMMRDADDETVNYLLDLRQRVIHTLIRLEQQERY